METGLQGVNKGRRRRGCSAAGRVVNRTRFYPPRSATLSCLAAAVLIFLFVGESQPVRATGPLLAWDEDPAAAITGFAVTVDGVRSDYGMTPLATGGTCGCSIPLPFTNGRHIVVVSAYNADGEGLSPPFVV